MIIRDSSGASAGLVRRGDQLDPAALRRCFFRQYIYGAAIALATCLVTACTSSGSSYGSPLHGVTNGSIVGGAFVGNTDTPYEQDMRDLCTATGEPIHIKKVTPWKPTGAIPIIDWGVRVDPRRGPASGPNEGGLPMKVTQVGGFSTGPVTVRCDSKHDDERL